MGKNTISYWMKQFVASQLRQAFLEEGVVTKNVTFSLSNEVIEKINKISDNNKLLETQYEVSGLPVTKSDILSNAIEAYYEAYLNGLDDLNVKIETEDFIQDEEKNQEDAAPKVADTIIVSSNSYESFEEHFLKNRTWEATMASWRVPNLTHVTVYVGRPLSKITHYAEIIGRELLDNNRYRFTLGEPIPLEQPIELTPYGMGVRNPRFTTLETLKKSKYVSDLSEWWIQSYTKN